MKIASSCVGIVLTISMVPVDLLAYHNNVHWVLDERHILFSWPPSALAWLHRHAVPDALRVKIDTVLATPVIMAILSSIYRDYYLSDEQMKTLQTAGFSFLGGKLNIFEIRAIPGYVFKMASPRNGHPELLNLGRIVEAEKIRKSAQAWKMKTALTIPKKYAYIVPLSEVVAYRDQPKVIVVSEKISLSCERTVGLRHRLLKLWLLVKRVPDLKTRNMIAITTGLALIDTEPWNKPIAIPGFAKAVMVDHFQVQRDAQAVDVFQTRPQNLSSPGRTGVTMQGLMVHQSRHPLTPCSQEQWAFV